MSRLLAGLAVAALGASLSGCVTPCCYCYAGDSSGFAVPGPESVRAEVPVVVTTTNTTARY